MNFVNLSLLYKEELLQNVIPFWLQKSQDTPFGGYFTCLKRNGEVFDTDKFIWLQARQVWLFSYLYNKVEKKQEWLKCAIQGGEFLKKWGHDGQYNWHFSLTREGKPLIAPYNIFSYTFSAMAFGQLYLATGNEEYAHIAKVTYQTILEKSDNPKGKWNKAIPGARDLKGFALPMIMCNLSLELEPLLNEKVLNNTIETCIHEVMEVFYKPELGLIVENVTADGQLSDSFEGRQVNPGHTLEAMWFIMDLGVRLNKPELIEKAVRISLDAAAYGWDKEYEGFSILWTEKGILPSS